MNKWDSRAYRELAAHVLADAALRAIQYRRLHQLDHLPSIRDIKSADARDAFIYIFPDHYGVESEYYGHPYSCRSLCEFLDYSYDLLRERVMDARYTCVGNKFYECEKYSRDNGRNSRLEVIGPDGEVMKFISIREASLSIGLSTHQIMGLADSGKTSPGGYSFRRLSKKKILGPKMKAVKIVYGYRPEDKDRVFKSTGEAARAYGIFHQMVSYSIKHNTKVAGGRFQFVECKSF